MRSAASWTVAIFSAPAKIRRVGAVPHQSGPVRSRPKWKRDAPQLLTQPSTLSSRRNTVPRGRVRRQRAQSRTLLVEGDRELLLERHHNLHLHRVDGSAGRLAIQSAHASPSQPYSIVQLRRQLRTPSETGPGPRDSPPRVGPRRPAPAPCRGSQPQGPRTWTRRSPASGAQRVSPAVLACLEA